MPADIPEVVRTALTGAGAPFEMGRHVVVGYDRTVFVRQPRNLREMFDLIVSR